MITIDGLPIMVRQVGRNPDNPSIRHRSEKKYVQRLEIKDEGISGCLTSVGKDNYVLDIENKVTYEYRIRKLTPRECWRLMGDKDSDFEKAEAVNSNTQLYKEAGNAICKNVLMALFSQLNIEGVTPWNDLTEDERDALVTDGCYVVEVA